MMAIFTYSENSQLEKELDSVFIASKSELELLSEKSHKSNLGLSIRMLFQKILSKKVIRLIGDCIWIHASRKSLEEKEPEVLFNSEIWSLFIFNED